MKRFAAYCRVSTGKQEKEQTIKAQVMAINDWAKENDAMIVDWYKDEGWSGTILARPKLDELRIDAKKELWEAVIIYDPDRLARKYSYQELVIDELKDAGLQVLFVTTPPPQDESDKLLYGVKGLFAEYERAKIAERFRLGKLRKAREKKLIGHHAPYGYRYILRTQKEEGYFEVYEPEAEIVRMIFHWVADNGYSFRKVVKELYRLGIKSAKGKKEYWPKSSVARLLNRRDYIGISYYNRNEAVEPKNPIKVEKYKRIKKSSRKARPKDDWFEIPVPRIIEDDLFNRAKQKMRENFLYGKRNKHYGYLLTGKVMCACGSKRVGDGVNGHHYYRCAARIYKFPLPNKCTYEGVNAEVLDQMVWNKVLSLLNHPETIKPQVRKWNNKRQLVGDKSKEKKEHIESQLNKLIEEENRYTEAFGAGIITFEKFKELAKDIKAKKDVIESQKYDVIESQSLENDVMGDFDTLCRNVAYTLQYSPVADRQARLRSVIESIYVGERNKAVVNGRIPVVTQPQNIQDESIGRNRGTPECGEEHSL